MTTPSLVVVIIPGWGVKSSSLSNLFSHDKVRFLDGVTSSYPTLLLDPPNAWSSLRDVYKSAFSSQAESFHTTLLSQLNSHHIFQSYVSDVERYHSLTSAGGGEEAVFSNVEKHYLEMPAVADYADIPATTIPELKKHFDAFITKHTRGGVLFLSVNAIYTLALTKKTEALAQSVKATEKFVNYVLEKALPNGARVLITSDGGLADSYADFLEGKMTNNRSDAKIPIIFAHKELEGVSASSDDFDISMKKQVVVGDFQSLLPTVLSMMEIYVPENLTTKILFEDLIPRTL